MTHATTVSLCTSSPLHRECTTSIVPPLTLPVWSCIHWLSPLCRGSPSCSRFRGNSLWFLWTAQPSSSQTRSTLVFPVSCSGYIHQSTHFHLLWCILFHVKLYRKR